MTDPTGGKGQARDPRPLPSAPQVGLGTEGMREERRIVTALFADLVGSTVLTEQMDPEDAREILGEAVRLVIGQVDALGGTVKDLAGDGVLALFGAPVAHEDDAERAVLCGLRIASTIADYADRVAAQWGFEGFDVRVGVETGRAVLGRSGGGSRVEYGATGDAINTAARLQGQAQPGQVLVGTATRTMIDSRFVWDEPHAFDLKGKQLPVEASVVRAYSPHRPLTPAFGEVPLVARTAELQVIATAITQLRQGDGPVLTLVGEAGVGKSRLVEEARRLVERDVPDASWLATSASSFATSDPYQLYRSLVLSWLGIPLDTGRSTAQRLIEERAAALPPDQSSPLRDLAASVSGPSTDGGSAEEQQERVFVAVEQLLGALARERPLVVVLEDLQWSDPTSLLLTEHVVEHLTGVALLLVLTLRPEPTALTGLDRIEAMVGARSRRLTLAPLDREDERRLLRELLRDADLPHVLEERVLDTTDGNPFFVEEQARALLTTGALEQAHGRLLFVGRSDLPLEPTVERALMARIDRLGTRAHDTLLAAAVLGPSFDVGLVSALTGFDATGDLDELQRGELVTLVDALGGGGPAYRFCHALVQEATYASLLRRHRRLLHARAAAALEERYRGREDEIAATLGHHLAQGGEPERAVGHLRTAAREAVATFANAEAVTLAREALALIDRSSPAFSGPDRTAALELLDLEATAERAMAGYDAAVSARYEQLNLLDAADLLGQARVRSLIGQTLMEDHRYDEALAELDLAEEGVAGPPEGDEAFALWLEVMLARGSVYYWTADHARYSELLARVEPIVAARATREQRIAYYGSVRAALWRRDKYVISDELARFDRELFESERDNPDEDARAWSLFQHGFTLMWHRDLDEAEPLLQESLALAERLGSALLRARALTYLMLTARLRGDTSAAAALVEPVREAAVEAELPEYAAMASATTAWAALRAGDPSVARREGVRALEVFTDLPNRYPLDWLACFPLLAVATQALDPADARRWAQMMLADDQQRLPEAIDRALRAGVAAAEHGDADQALDQFRAAVDEARRGRFL